MSYMSAHIESIFFKEFFKNLEYTKNVNYGNGM